MSLSYKKLEEFADEMRVERNSYLVEKLELEERIKDLETKLYYCLRNKKLTNCNHCNRSDGTCGCANQ
tara:strand:- start:366 stop:569 length:204 start_codon:yes stop_codon:yes gene_type:complete